VEAKLADEATLRSLLSLDAVVAPRKRGRPAAGGKAKAKACDVADADRCLGCKWGGGDLEKAHCTAAADSERADQLCSGCGGNWDVVWADRKADGRVTFGPKADNPSGVAWFGFWGIDRVPVWPGEANCVHTKPGAKTSSGNGVSLAKSLDAAAGGSRKHGVWHKAREAWVAAGKDEAADAGKDAGKDEAELEADATVVAEQQTRDFDGLPYVVASVDDQLWAWPAGDWVAAPQKAAVKEAQVALAASDASPDKAAALAKAEAELAEMLAAVPDYGDADSAVAQVDETDGSLSFTDMDVHAVHDEQCTPA